MSNASQSFWASGQRPPTHSECHASSCSAYRAGWRARPPSGGPGRRLFSAFATERRLTLNSGPALNWLNRSRCCSQRLAGQACHHSRRQRRPKRCLRDSKRKFGGAHSNHWLEGRSPMSGSTIELLIPGLRLCCRVQRWSESSVTAK